jgi:hypothetical protein
VPCPARWRVTIDLPGLRTTLEPLEADDAADGLPPDLNPAERTLAEAATPRSERPLHASVRHVLMPCRGTAGFVNVPTLN